MRLQVLAFGLGLVPLQLSAQERLPIIDMHLHAFAADAQGPPPLAMGTPIDPFPAWDPAQPYAATFLAMFKKPPCADPVWSPMTDRELMQQTLEVMERLNIIAVVSGSSERWRPGGRRRRIV